MKRTVILFFSIVLLGGLIFFSSCDLKDPTMGNLSVTVIDPNGNLIANEQVYLATSYQNMNNGKYVVTGWTNSNGTIKFLDLLPGFYWYDTQHWDDYGAVEVYAGIDQFTYLWVNSPSKPKK